MRSPRQPTQRVHQNPEAVCRTRPHSSAGAAVVVTPGCSSDGPCTWQLWPTLPRTACSQHLPTKARTAGTRDAPLWQHNTCATRSATITIVQPPAKAADPAGYTHSVTHGGLQHCSCSNTPALRLRRPEPDATGQAAVTRCRRRPPQCCLQETLLASHPTSCSSARLSATAA